MEGVGTHLYTQRHLKALVYMVRPDGNTPSVRVIGRYIMGVLGLLSFARLSLFLPFLF